VEILRALGSLAEPPAGGHERIATLLGLPAAPDAAAYAQTMMWQLYPYASAYLGDEGMLGGEARDRVAGFLRSLDVVPPPEPDHLATLLGAYSELCEREGHASADERAAWRRARAAMLWEHLLSWMPAYLGEVIARAPDPYPTWAALLDEALLREADTIGPPARIPLALRVAAPLPDPRDAGAGAFLGALLTPVRSGVIISRTVLGAAAVELGLGTRLGERRFMLRALLGQDATATLRWLASHAASVGDGWDNRSALLAPVAHHWRDRALAASGLLTALADEAAHLDPLVVTPS
jgi:hypothetical protein